MAQKQQTDALWDWKSNRVRNLVQRGYAVLVSAQLIKPLALAWGTRCALYTLTILFIGLFPGEAYTKPDFWQALSQWDGEWYLKIATEGYQWNGPTVQSAVVFWPLYPALGKITGMVVGNLHWGFLVVTTLSFFFFLYFLYRLTLLDFSEQIAERAIIYAAVFPGAFVLGAFYSEATAFALAVAAFYYARRGRWGWAVALGFFASLTRLPGVAILFPIAYEYWRQKGIRWQALALGIIPLGTLAFAVYIWQLTGSPWTIFTAEETAWFRGSVPPWEQVYVALDRALWPRTHYIVAVNLLDAGSILLSIGMTIWVLAKMPATYWLYSVPVLIGALSITMDPSKAPPTASVTRFLMAIFPTYIALAQIARHALIDQSIRWTFAILMGVFAIYFFSHAWVL